MRSVRTPLAATAAALLLCALASVAGAGSDSMLRGKFHSSIRARSGERLNVNLESGAGLRITTWDKNEVDVESEGGLEDCPDADLSIERVPGGVSLASKYTSKSDVHNCSLVLLVRVPKRFDVSVRSSGGGLQANDLRGTIEGKTGGGEVQLTRVRGTLRFSTGGGDIRVSDSDLDGRISTGGGDVTFVRVTGDLVGSSGSMRRPVYAENRTR